MKTTLQKKFGKTREVGVGMGSSRPGVIGMRLEQKEVLVTPLVPFMFGGKELSLSMSEGFKLDKYTPDCVSITLQEDDRTMELLRIGLVNEQLLSKLINFPEFYIYLNDLLPKGQLSLSNH